MNRNNSAIHTVNRAQLLDDSLNLARASLLPYDVAFNVTQYIKDDDEYLPWESFLSAFAYISTMLIRSPSYGLFKVSSLIPYMGSVARLHGREFFYKSF